MYVVRLLQKPVAGCWAERYFPRVFKYKKEAENVQRMVEAQGGKAVITKDKKTAEFEAGTEITEQQYKNGWALVAHMEANNESKKRIESWKKHLRNSRIKIES